MSWWSTRRTEERAVRHVSDGTLAIREVRKLGAAMLVGMDVGILKEKHNNFVSGVKR